MEGEARTPPPPLLNTSKSLHPLPCATHQLKDIHPSATTKGKGVAVSPTGGALWVAHPRVGPAGEKAFPQSCSAEGAGGWKRVYHCTGQKGTVSNQGRSPILRSWKQSATATRTPSVDQIFTMVHLVQICVVKCPFSGNCPFKGNTLSTRSLDRSASSSQ